MVLIWKLPGEHAHRFVSYVILDPAKLTIKINSCFECQASSLMEPLNGLKWEGKELEITDIHLPRGKPLRKSCNGQLGGEWSICSEFEKTSPRSCNIHRMHSQEAVIKSLVSLAMCMQGHPRILLSFCFSTCLSLCYFGREKFAEETPPSD